MLILLCSAVFGCKALACATGGSILQGNSTVESSVAIVLTGYLAAAAAAAAAAAGAVACVRSDDEFDDMLVQLQTKLNTCTAAGLNNIIAALPAMGSGHRLRTVVDSAVARWVVHRVQVG
jgi:hypothetical protein